MHPPHPHGVTTRPSGFSLEWKIPLLMTVVLALGLAVMLVITYTTVRGRSEGIVRDRLLHAAREIARTVGPSLQGRVAALAPIAADPAVVRALSVRPVAMEDRAEASRRLATLRNDRDTGFTAELWDARGRTTLSVGRAVTGDRRPAVAPGSAPPGPYFGPMALANGRAHFWVAVPVMRGSERVGWVAWLRHAGGPADATRMLREFTREDVSMYLRNADHSVWIGAPSRPVAPPLGRDSAPAGLRVQRPEGWQVSAEAPIEGTPWVIALEVPVSSIVRRPRRTIRLLAQLSVLLVMAGGLISWWIGRQVTRPVRALTLAAETVARGTYPGAVDAGGDEIGRLAASFDAMALQVEAARRALEQRADDAQRARDTAEEANRSKTKFLSAMSHELRTPLNAIGGYAQLMEMGLHGPVTQEQREVLARIGHSQAHLLALIEDLLGFAQLEAGRVRFAVEEVPLAETVAELEGLVEPQAAARRVRVGFAAGGPEVRARADRDKVRQVALNLVVNAIKFTPAGGEVAVECAADEERVRLQVSDTGIGIPPEQFEQIFEPFVQGERAPDRASEGVGLGLAISRELARGMGGEVTVASAPGRGSVFTLILPRAGSPEPPGGADAAD
jgi:signal transduction histidine kinase